MDKWQINLNDVQNECKKEFKYKDSKKIYYEDQSKKKSIFSILIVCLIILCLLTLIRYGYYATKYKKAYAYYETNVDESRYDRLKVLQEENIALANEIDEKGIQISPANYRLNRLENIIQSTELYRGTIHSLNFTFTEGVYLEVEIDKTLDSEELLEKLYSEDLYLNEIEESPNRIIMNLKGGL